MCSGLGAQPNVSGFTFDDNGQLTPIPGSTRPLSGIPNSGCTQVAFDKTRQQPFPLCGLQTQHGPSGLLGRTASGTCHADRTSCPATRRGRGATARSSASTSTLAEHT